MVSDLDICRILLIDHLKRYSNDNVFSLAARCPSTKNLEEKWNEIVANILALLNYRSKLARKVIQS